MKAVKFDRYGDIDVLEVRDVPRLVPGAGEVLVEVRAAGINPSEAVIRSGALHHLFPSPARRRPPAHGRGCRQDVPVVRSRRFYRRS